jgi:hypothetical protein
MLRPQVEPPFPLAWGFSTRQDETDLPPVRLSQVHGCGVVEASDAVVEGDGLWTTTPGVRIGVRVADCVPILLAGPLPQGRQWIAALHAGWRGATAGILRRGVKLFKDQGGAPRDLVWALGPAIQVCHFEVGPEVIEAAKADPAWRDDLQRMGPKGKPHLDLHGFLKAQGADLGLDPAKDGSVGLCTLCQRDLLHSYRGGDTKARQWGWVELR